VHVISSGVCRLDFALSLFLSLLLHASFAVVSASAAGSPQPPLQASDQHGSEHHYHPRAGATSWEGSLAGKAYSEFNHHLAGLFVVVIGVSELIPVLGIAGCGMRGPAVRRLKWIGFLLPAALLLTGLYLMIWSDHEGWPIGSRSLAQTYFGDDWEMIQHKLFGIMSLTIGVIEGLRRLGWLQRIGWRLPLPGLAILGGLSLFLHSHGAHPAAHKIALHHAVMGAMAVTAGTSKLASIWNRTSGPERWELVWGALVVLIGLQLLIYSE
jgi:hypothetical protein